MDAKKKETEASALESIILDVVVEKKRNIFLLLIAISLLSCISLVIISGLPAAHDLFFHLDRISAIKALFETGNIGSYIYPNYLTGYGYGNPLFYPDIFLHIPAFFHYLGMDLITSYKIFLFIISVCAVLTMYYAVNGITGNKKAAIFSTFIYCFASYRLVDLFSRAALGESIAFVFAPLAIYGIYELIYGDYKKYYILVIGMTGIVLGHVISTFLLVFLILILCLVNIKGLFREKTRILYLAISVIVTFLLTSFYWLPLLEQVLHTKFAFPDSAISISTYAMPIILLFIDLPYKWFTSTYLPMSVGISTFAFIFIFFLNWKANTKEPFLKFCFIIGTIVLVCSTRIFPWNLVNIIAKPLQYPWRLYFIATLLLSIGVGLLINKIPVKHYKLFRIATCLSLIPFLMVCYSNFLAIKVTSSPGSSLGGAEYLPASFPKNAHRYTANRGEFVDSVHDIDIDFTRNNLSLAIAFDNNDGHNSLELPLTYYKGYSAMLNKAQIEVYETQNGLVGVDIIGKTGVVSIDYKGTDVQKISRFISLISGIVFMIYLIWVNRSAIKIGR